MIASLQYFCVHSVPIFFFFGLSSICRTFCNKILQLISGLDNEGDYDEGQRENFFYFYFVLNIIANTYSFMKSIN